MSVVYNGTSYHGSTSTTLIRNFNAGKYKLRFDDQHNGTKDNNGNKRYKEAVILDENTSATFLLL